MENKIHVGNLPFKTKDEDLEKLFSQFGKVTEANVITEKFSGRSKGFGFVGFEDAESVEKAVAELDGKDFEGRDLKVSKAKPREENRDRDNRDFKPRGFDRGPQRFDNRDRDSRRDSGNDSQDF